MKFTILCSMDRASYNMAIIIQQDATEFSLFKSVRCSTCFRWYFIHHQELITLYVQYLALMRPVLLPVLNFPIQPCSQQVALHVSLMPDTVYTVLWAPDDGCIITRNMLISWQI